MSHRIPKFVLFAILPVVLPGLSSCEKNYPPRIFNTEFVRTPGLNSTTFILSVEASDANHDPLTYLWESHVGTFTESPEKRETTWEGPQVTSDSEYEVTITISDGKLSTTESLMIPIIAPTFGKVFGSAFFTGTTIPIYEAVISVFGKTDTTNIKGEFEIDGIRAGRQTISGKKPDFTTGKSDLIVQQGVNETIVYMSSPINSTKLYGRCLGNMSGEPKFNLEIIILNPDKKESALRGRSDDSGYYEISLIPHGLRYIIVKDEIRVRGETLVYLDTTTYLFNVPIREPFKFTDSRDNKEYEAVRIGGQIWMAENLAYIPHVSPPEVQGGIWVFGYSGTDVNEAKEHENYGIYGCLYDWQTSMSNQYDNSDICPPGWHLPTDAEWKNLETTMGLEVFEADSVGWRQTGDVGRKLKAGFGWESEGNGSNSSSFTALPGGNRSSTGSFLGIPGYANFWMATEWNEDERYAWRRYLFYNRDAIGRYTDYKTSASSVRCVKNR